MKNINILDCTLRDGGYYTNWDFDKDLIKRYIQSIKNLPIEYIELGYRSKLKNEYRGEYYYLPLSTIKMIKDITTKKLSIMLDAKDCVLEELDDLLLDIKKEVSLIRIATDPKKIDFSITLAKEIKKFGFKVAINVMYISTINQNHMFFDYLNSIEDDIDTLNLVDSYGSIYPEDLEILIGQVKEKTNVTLGFHGHNNLELAFTNTLTAIKCGISFVDSTILGMGRGAGNLKTELILTHLKSKQSLDIDLNSIAKLTELFSPLLSIYKWGTNFPYMVSGSYELPQKDVMEALEIDRYSLSGIVNQLQCKNTKRFSIFDDIKSFKKCLIIGGGFSIEVHIAAIKSFLRDNKDILVIYSSSKYIFSFEDINNTQYFAVSGDELLKLKNTKRIEKYILEPTPRKVNTFNEKNMNFYELKKITFTEDNFDSPLTISLQIALDMQMKNIFLVGFDGYSELKSKKELYLMQENQEVINKFIAKNELTSLTSSKYKNLKQKSIYGMIS